MKAFAHKVSFAEFAAFLCLGQKYDIPELYLEAKRKLFDLCPATVGAYISSPQMADWHDIEPPVGEYMELVILSRRTGLLSILPWALYECTEYSTDKILNGIKNSDGSSLCLSPQDQTACLAGFHNAIRTQAQTTLGWIKYPDTLSPSCSTPEHCGRARERMGGRLVTPSDPLITRPLWIYEAADEWIPEDICRACYVVAHASYTAGRIEFWDRLPAMFGLPPWTELLKERKEAVMLS